MDVIVSRGLLECLQGDGISYIIKCGHQKMDQRERARDFGTEYGDKTCQKF